MSAPSGGQSTRPDWLIPGSGPVAWVTISLALFLILGILYPGQVFQRQIFLSSDSMNANFFAMVGDAALAKGDYPQWNPYLFAGMPSFGSLAYTKFLYPPSIVLTFLQQKMNFPPMTWLLAHLFFGGLGMAWLLSRWKLPVGALLLGSLIWLMAPKIVAWSVHGHGTKVGAAMYLPWIVGWVWKVLDGKGALAIGMTGLLLGLQLLRGHVQITYYTLLVVGGLLLCHAFWPLDETARRLIIRLRLLRVGQVLAGIALGFLIGSILLIPVYEYAGISIRGQDTQGGGGVGIEYATQWSLGPAELSTLLFPAAAGFGKATYLGVMPFNDYPSYFGILTLVLAALAWWSAGRRLTIALLVMSAVAILVSLGRHGPGLYEFMYNWLPFFNKFRIPSMILVLVTFAGAILAPHGAAAWARGAVPSARSKLWPFLLLVVGAICLVGGLTALAKGPFTTAIQGMAAEGGRKVPAILLDEAWVLHKSSLIRIGLILLVAGSAFLASLSNSILRGKYLVWILIALMGLDMFSVDRLVVRPESGLLQVGRDETGRTRLVAAAPMSGPFRGSGGVGVGSDLGTQALARNVGHDRVYPLGEKSSWNSWMVAGVRSLSGYHPAKLAAYEQIRRRLFSDRPAGRLANWLGGSVVALDGLLTEDQLLFLEVFGFKLVSEPLHTGTLTIYRNEAAQRRARLMTRWAPVSSLESKDALEPFLDGIQDGTISVDRQVYLLNPPDPLPVEHPNSLPDPEFLVDGLDEVVLKVETPVPALLLLADMFAPGWKVQVDGEDRPLLKADLVLRAVALEAGSHTVRFVYSDPTVRAGLLVSLCGGILALFLILFPLVRRVMPGEASNHSSDRG